MPRAGIIRPPQHYVAVVRSLGESVIGLHRKAGAVAHPPTGFTTRIVDGIPADQAVGLVCEETFSDAIISMYYTSILIPTRMVLRLYNSHCSNAAIYNVIYVRIDHVGCHVRRILHCIEDYYST